MPLPYDHIRLAGPAETTGPAGNLELVTLSEALAYLGLTSDGGAQDALIQTLLNNVHTAVFHETGGRHIKLDAATDFDEVYSVPSDRFQLYLNQYPISSITSIQVGGMDGDASFSAYSTLSSSNYYSDKRSGRVFITYFGAWPSGNHGVRVLYKAGFSTIPADIKDVVCQWVGIKHSRLSTNRWDILAKGVEGTSYTASELPESSQKVLNSYKLAVGSFG